MAADASDVDAALLLASAYREAGRGADATGLVERFLAENPGEAGLTVMAGVLAEDAGDYDAAAGHYADYLRDQPDGPLAAEVERRQENARREGFRADVRRALE